jgi:hypothetical protein
MGWEISLQPVKNETERDEICKIPSKPLLMVKQIGGKGQSSKCLPKLKIARRGLQVFQSATEFHSGN